MIEGDGNLVGLVTVKDVLKYEYEFHQSSSILNNLQGVGALGEVLDDARTLVHEFSDGILKWVKGTNYNVERRQLNDED